MRSNPASQCTQAQAAMLGVCILLAIPASIREHTLHQAVLNADCCLWAPLQQATRSQPLYPPESHLLLLLLLQQHGSAPVKMQRCLASSRLMTAPSAGYRSFLLSRCPAAARLTANTWLGRSGHDPAATNPPLGGDATKGIAPHYACAALSQRSTRNPMQVAHSTAHPKLGSSHAAHARGCGHKPTLGQQQLPVL